MGTDKLQGATLYFDCHAGIAGDMTLGALLDLGVPESVVRDALAKLDLVPWELRVGRVRRGGMMGIHIEVLESAPGAPGHRHEHAHTHAGVSGHAHEHEHTHAGASGHDHGHAHDGAPGHDHAHEHRHPHEADPSHRHEHGHPHAHAHPHEHTHSHAHTHESPHEHAHPHEHADPHAHSHAHTHVHEHTHTHEHARHEHGPAHAPHEHGHAHAHHPAHGPTHAPGAGAPHGPAHAGAHADHPHVHYAQIRALITAAGLDPDIVRRSLDMFDRVAAVEAAIHGVAVADVAFHELGALDSIIDIVGTAAALSWLRPARVVASTVRLGAGTVWTAHGRLPVPAPATAALLAGAPVLGEADGPQFELTTPTGAAILAANVTEYGALPAMRVEGIGYGAGTRELADRPNLLRVVAGTELAGAARPGPAGTRCTIVEANIDDMNPELYEPLFTALFAAGARDVWLTPVHMKKGRPGVVVSALGDPDRRAALAEALLRESTTLGVRSHEVERTMLDRTVETVETPYGPVAVKLGRDPHTGAVWNVAPEYAVCVERARAHGVPVKEVYAAAAAAYRATAPRRPAG